MPLSRTDTINTGRHGTTGGRGRLFKGLTNDCRNATERGKRSSVLLLAVIRVLKEIVDESGKTQKIFLLLILGLCMYAASPNKRNDACLLVELHTMYLSSLNYGSTAILVWRVVIFQPL